jgi:CHAT domain-containing protein/Tfp pilus assembly protein PilF
MNDIRSELKSTLCVLVFFLFASLPLIPAAQQTAKPLPEGVMIASAEKDGGGAKAGLLPGDMLVSWARAACPTAAEAEGTFCTCFDLRILEIKEAPLGPITFKVRRNGKALSFTPDQKEEWKIKVMPPMSKQDLASYENALSRLKEGSVSDGLKILDAAIKRLKEKKLPASAAWLLFKAAIATEKTDPGEAQKLYDRLLSLLEQFPLEKALAFTGPGRFQSESGNYDEAMRSFGKAIGLIEIYSPDSLFLAGVLSQTGSTAFERGDLGTARQFHQRAVTIREKLTPDSPILAGGYSSLGVIARESGDLAEAEKLHLKALVLRERILPESIDVAQSLNNLGLVAYNRGDFAAAEKYYSRSMGLKEKLAPGSLTLATTISNLGMVADARKDMQTAEDLYKRALVIRHKLSPGSISEAQTLNNLGALSFDKGDLTASEDYQKRALEIRSKLMPDSLEEAMSYINLGNLERSKKKFDLAENYMRKALAIEQKVAPGNLDEASCLEGLGHIFALQDKHEAAGDCFIQAVAICEKLAPGTSSHADALYNLGCNREALGDIKSAEECLLKAVGALDSQREMLGGTRQDRERFSAAGADIYRKLADIQIKLGKKKEAFETLEKFRARSLLEMLAERNMDFRKDAPESLLQERAQALDKYNLLQSELANIDPLDSASVEDLRRRLNDVRISQQEIGERIRLASPRLASLTYPKPLGLEDTLKALPPGTLFLSYCAQEKNTFLFALLDGKFETFVLKKDLAGLSHEIRAFRALLLDPRSPMSVLQAKARGLYDFLLQPASAQIKNAEIILICPDGPLHSLPFSALMSQNGRYLVEEKPVGYTVSATVYSELAKEKRTAPSEFLLAAFGDPEYGSGGGITIAAERGVPSRGTLAPLPNTRKEVEAIGALFQGRSRLYLGAGATEEAAKEIDPNTAYIHFACHGRYDAEYPLDSGLALSGGSKESLKDNGYLQAWEIFESMRIDADLVTLSACETALGKEMGGEGLIGLTRSFQYAGARTVLASLWSVSDESTARLMERFYFFLKAGKPKAEALRLAQQELAKGKKNCREFIHPFFWSAFELNGDLR